MKRFYKTVSVGKDKQDYVILLDGKQIKTPAGNILRLSSKKTADLIVNEWNDIAENENINPQDMDYTNLASTTIDKIIPNRNEIVENICSYAMNDLICYRNNEIKILQKMQSDSWDSELEWARKELNMPLVTTDSIMPVNQDIQVYKSANKICDKCCDYQLTALADLVGNLGSFVLSWGVLSGKLDFDSAWEKSHIDESYQNQVWGVDDERLKSQKIIKQNLYKTIKFYKTI